jgi:hypothetical protein
VRASYGIAGSLPRSGVLFAHVVHVQPRSLLQSRSLTPFSPCWHWAQRRTRLRLPTGAGCLRDQSIGSIIENAEG